MGLAISIASVLDLRAPVPVAEIQQPAASIEERSDEMLFEIGALVATPFDQAILFPFN
ncbi:hypothetical protein [Pontiella sp.]|uniref:hypothetical protein n=1 Tax=Pontiella sp. TaxID=2837462 RepID=UPI003567C08A